MNFLATFETDGKTWGSSADTPFGFVAVDGYARRDEARDAIVKGIAMQLEMAREDGRLTSGDGTDESSGDVEIVTVAA